MSENPSQAPAPAAGPVSPAPQMQPVWSRVTHGLSPAFLIATVALLLSVWQWTVSQRDSVRLQTELARRLAEVEASNRETRLTADQIRNSLRDMESRMGMMDAKLIETQNQRIALESLYQELARNRDEWVLAEIEQILIAANQQLQLAGNVRSALIALEAADKRLAQADRPGLLTLRRVIARDIDRLRNAPIVDVPGLALKLDNLIAAVDELPIASDQRPGMTPVARDTSASAWRGFLREIWFDLRDVLRIRVADTREVPLLSPEQSFFVRENLKLKLLSARLALLSRNELGWRSDTKTAEQWLRQYFDTSAKPVSSAQTTLKQFFASDLAVQMPDIGESLQAVRQQTSSRRGGLR
jgi:uroporphyrin-3 C-methyltransferase